MNTHESGRLYCNKGVSNPSFQSSNLHFFRPRQYFYYTRYICIYSVRILTRRRRRRARVVYTSRRQLDYFTLLTPIQRKREREMGMERDSDGDDGYGEAHREWERERPHKFKHRTVVMKYGNLFWYTRDPEGSVRSRPLIHPFKGLYNTASAVLVFTPVYDAYIHL